MQAAIDAQSGMPLHGSAADGQQSSIGSDADISVISCDLNLNAAAPAAGSEATDNTIRRANMVRAKAMWRQYPVTAVRGQVTILRGTQWQSACPGLTYDPTKVITG